MKRFAMIGLLLCAAFAAHGQWYTGWSRQTGLALSLHLTDSMPVLYSPMQSTDPLVTSFSSRRGDTLNVECASVGFRMWLVPDGECLRGVWRQGVLKEDITFCPADTLFQLRRPQTPQPPFSFDEEAVEVDYTDSQGNAVHLSGTLALPRNAGRRFPTVVMVSGSGQQNRDEELMFHKPFLVLADYLASRGIASVRYDDRGVGQSMGPLDSADTRLFAEDAEAILSAVMKDKRVDRRQVGLLGHSEGGAIAALVAARNRDVAFVVMMAGAGCAGKDILLQQNEAIYAATGVADSLVAVRMACMREAFDMPLGSSQKDYKALIDRHTVSLDKEQKESIGLGRGAASALRQQIENRWMRTFLVLDPAEYLTKLRCPLLALNGNRDCQVVAAPNLDRIREVTKHRAQCYELQGLNHLFQHCTTGTPDEYVRIEETMAPEAMAAVAEWVLSLRK